MRLRDLKQDLKTSLAPRKGSLRALGSICLLLLMAGAGPSCTQKKEPEAATANAPMASNPIPAAPIGCPPLPAAQKGCSGTPAAIVPFLHESERVMERDIGPEACTHWRALMDEIGQTDLSGLKPAVAIYLQNTALRILARSSSCSDQTLAMDADALVSTLALDAKEVTAMQRQSMPLDGLLGAGWQERNPSDFPMQHERRSEHTWAYRIARNGNKRALVATTVVRDAQGELRVVPWVTHIEHRQGFGMDAPACVYTLAPEKIGCAALPLHPLALADIPENAFYGRQDHGLFCNACHLDDKPDEILLIPEDPSDLWPLREKAVLDALRTHLNPS
jgi:hypothetical protein